MNVNSFPKKMSELVGDRDPFEILTTTPTQLASIVDQHTTDQLRVRPFQGKWTPNEILGHSADNELIMAYRVRCVSFENNPMLYGYSQEVWVSRQEHNLQEPTVHLTTFNRLRSDNLRLWQRLSEVDFRRTYHRCDRGPESLGQLLIMHAGHDLSHLDQLERYLDAVSEGSK